MRRQRKRRWVKEMTETMGRVSSDLALGSTSA
jgi:hypothetical protein